MHVALGRMLHSASPRPHAPWVHQNRVQCPQSPVSPIRPSFFLPSCPHRWHPRLVFYHPQSFCWLHCDHPGLYLPHLVPVGPCVLNPTFFNTPNASSAASTTRLKLRRCPAFPALRSQVLNCPHHLPHFAPANRQNLLTSPLPPFFGRLRPTRITVAYR